MVKKKGIKNDRFIRIIILFCCTSFFCIPINAQVQKTWQWVKQLGGDSWDVSAGIICDSKNNLYVAGSYFNTLNCDTKSIVSDGNQDIFLSKFDEKGNLNNLWRAGGRGGDHASSICLLPDDKILICGSVSDSAVFGKLRVSGSGKKLFITILDGDGSFLWISELFVKGEATLNLSGADKTGDIYIAGVFSGTLTSQDKQITSKGKKDIFLARLNPLGSVENLLSIGSEEDETASSLDVDYSGNIVFSGTFGKNIETGNIKLSVGPDGKKSNAFVARLDSEFNPLWINTLTSDDYSEISSLKFDREGNLYAAGSFSSVVYLRDTVIHSSGYSDILVMKLKSDGNSEWVRNFGSGYYDYVAELNIDNLGGAIVSGSLGDTLLIDSLTVEPLNENNSAFIVQFSPEGKAIWADCISGTGRNFSDGSVLDNSGNLYFTGSFRNEFEKVDDVLTSYGDQDLFVAKYFNCSETEAEISGLRYFCPGSETELSVRRIYSGVVWNDTIQGKYSIMVSKPGLYHVTMLDKKGCLVKGKVEITHSMTPIFTLGNDTTIFITDSLILKAPEDYIVDKWQDFSIDREFLARSSGRIPGEQIYWLTVMDSLDCSFTDTIAVTYKKGYEWFNSSGSQIVAHPNPARERIWWSLKTDQSCRLNVDITDEKGIKVYHQIIERYIPGEEKDIYLGSLHSGIYYLRISDTSPDKNYKLLRIVKQ